MSMSFDAAVIARLLPLHREPEASHTAGNSPLAGIP